MLTESHIHADPVWDAVDEEGGEKYITMTAYAMCVCAT